MAEVSVRELRIRAVEVLDRVSAGERLVVTRGGRPVAELRSLRRSGPSASVLLGRRPRLPSLEADLLRRDLDGTIDSRL